MKKSMNQIPFSELKRTMLKSKYSFLNFFNQAKMKNLLIILTLFLTQGIVFGQGGLPPCTDTAQVLCMDGSNKLTLTAQAGLTNVMWYDSTSNSLIGTGSSIMIFGNHPSLADGYEAFYYTGDDASGCPGQLCCPVRVRTQDCTFMDLALRKTLNGSGPFYPGSNVTFTIEIINQGTKVATNVQVSDYIPSGLTLNDPLWTGSPATLVTPIASIAVGETVTRTITFTINSNYQGTSLRNWAEISAISGGTDIDSDPDGTNFNQPGETNDLNDDNVVNQNGKTGGDEDDHDPAELQVTQIFDLALKKTLSTTTPGPFTPGAAVTFDVKIYNQGTVTGTNIQLVDYIPTGLVLNDPSWTESSPGKATLNSTIATLNPGDSVVRTITFTISPSFMGSTIRNWAEIYSASNSLSLLDIDSDPDNINFNQLGETDDLADDNVVNQDGKNGGDEDDHDPAEINVGQFFDLALKKTLSSVTPGPFSPGSTVTFDIKVYNQGSVTATNVQISDYIPTGLTLSDANWTGNPATLVTAIPTIAVGDSVTRTITFTINSNYQGTTIRNWAEISAATNSMGLSDIDSDPDGTNFNQTGETDDLNDDNVVNQNGKSGGDEDDHDPAQINVQQVFDLALRKTLSPTPAGPYVPGGTVSFTIEVFNQGTVDATNVQITDYIPTGLTLSDATWTGNPATLVTPIASIPVGGSVTKTITFTVDANYQGSTIRNWAEISGGTNAANLADIDSDPDGTNFNQTGETNDLADDNVINQNGKTGGDEDDHDPAEVNITQTFDLALRKTLSSTTPGPFSPGSTVTFTIDVINQGTIDGTNVQITDYIPTGMILNDVNWTETTPGKATLNTPIATVAVGATVSRTITFTISPSFMGSTIRNWSEISGGTNALSLLDIDSDPDNINFNQPGETNDLADDNVVNQNGKTGGDEDDHDPAEITVGQVFDLALKKTLSSVTPGPFSPGSTVTFDIKIYNQGTLDATNVKIADYIPTGLTLADPNWVGNPAILITSIPTIAAGDSVTRTITFTINSNYQGTTIRNWAEISAATNSMGLNDIDSDPDGTNFNQTGETDDLNDDNVVNQSGKGGQDEDDHDPAQINVQQVFDLALRKTILTTTPVRPGDNVIFKIDVFNQGTVDADDVEITDYITSAYTFNPASNPGWIYSAPNATYLIPTLAAGASTSVNIVLTVNPGVSNLSLFTNEAEISDAGNAENLPDVDSDPDNNPNNDNDVQPGGPDDDVITENHKANPQEDEDDNDVAAPRIFDLALRKTAVTAGPYTYGQLIDFKITIFNQGNMTVNNIIASDYVPSGYDYVTSTANLWNYNTLTRVVTNTLYGPLKYGDSLSFIITMKLLPNAGDLKAYTNLSEIASARDSSNVTITNDYDSNPDTDPNNDIGGQPDTPTDNEINDHGTIDEDDHDPHRVQVVDLALRKWLITPAPHFYNQLQEFRIRVYNQGNVAMSQFSINDYIPVGYTFQSAPNPGWTGAAPTVSYVYNGTLNPGDSATITIYLTMVQAPSAYNSWINYAEISGMTDVAGVVRTTEDIDSDPNSNTTAEKAVMPGSSLDNDITDVTKVGDQDDHDPAGPEVFDLALRKTVLTAGPYVYGDVVTYTIKVFNQGNVIAKDPVISDYVPTGMSFEASNGPAWTYNSLLRIATRTIPVTLKPGDSASVTIALKILANGSDPNAYTNRAEITSAKDSVNTVRITDTDSRPDATLGNDVGGVPNSPTDDLVTDRGVIDEDDEDPAIIPIFDLALRKKVTSIAPYSPGNNVSFTLYVYNQGNQTVQNIKLRDYIPIGYSFNPALNPTWIPVLGGAETVIPGPLEPGANTEATIVLTVQNVTNGVSDYYNYGEITAFDDEQGTDATTKDVDSNPGSNNPIESSVLPGSPADDNITSTDKGGEEDDHDVATITFFDLALRKTVVTPGPYTYGQNVTFKICVYNQGLLAANNITIADKLPSGLEFIIGSNVGWNYNAGADDYHYTLVGPIAPMDSACVNITLRMKTNATGANAYVNEAEILRAYDPNGLGSDFDSDPDENFDNDNGGDPYGPTDNVIDDDGTNDEDDHDPATIPFYDLALKKLLETPAPYSYNQDITFRVRVFNQGGLPAKNIKIQDYIPDGFSFVSATSPFWTTNAQGAEYILDGVLYPGDSVDFVITLKVNRVTVGGYKKWINYAEITHFESVDGVDVTNGDIDSNPGSNNPIENSVFPDRVNDNNITSNDKGGEEDDHDPAGIYLVDLALRKTVETAGPYTYNQDIDFRIKVINQGNVAVQNYTITDYIPSGFQLVNAYGWTMDGANKATNLVTSKLAPGDSISLFIKLKILPNPGATDAYLNYAEVSQIKDTTGTIRTDVDSTPDQDPNNDGPEIDDEVNSPFDEDDKDPARIDVWDLALRKVYESGVIQYGSDLTFRISVFNQGTETARNIEIVDYIPVGYTYNSADNVGWSGSYPLVSTIIPGPIVPGDSASVTLVLKLINTEGGRRKWINYSEISESYDLQGNNRSNDDIDSRVNSDGPLERAVLPGRVNDNNITSINKGGEEDDHDPAGSGILFGDIYDLAQRKTVVTPGPYTYNQDVDFKITVFNQGNITAQNVQLVDYIPSGFEFVSAYGWTFDGVNKATNTIAGPIVPGDSAYVLIKLRTRPNPSSSTGYLNVAEITGGQDTTGVPRTDIDSTPDNDANNDGTPDDNEIDNNNQDEDDHDIERIDVYDLALKKELMTSAPYTYGQDHTYRIRVYNQGTLPVSNIVLNDYVPTGYAFNAGSNPGWTILAAPNIVYTQPGVLQPGDSFEVNLVLQLQRTSGGFTHWVNYGEVRRMWDVTGTIDVSSQDVDSDPNGDTPGERSVTPGSVNDNNITDITKAGDQDDHDPAGPQIFDMALRKKVLTPKPYRYGQNLTFEITVFNQGNVTAQNPVIADVVPQGYTFVAASNPSWTYVSGTRTATTTYNGNIIPGDSAKVTIILKLLPILGDATAWTNISEIKGVVDTVGNPRTDIDSNPDDNPNNDGDPKDDKIDDPTDEDDHDPETPEVLDLALRKWVMNEQPYYLPGQTVPFRLVVFNQGNVTASQVRLVDYIPHGYSFSAADNPGWSQVGNNLEYTHTTALAPTDSVVIMLRLVVVIPAGAHIKSWENYAEIKSVVDTRGANRDADDADSTPNTDTPRERSVHDGDPWDDTVDGNGTTDGVNEDDDDHDPEEVTVTAYLGDRVWKDADGDGVQDPGEMSLGNVHVYLYDCATGALVAKDTTDINGNYGFEGLLGDRSYYLRFDASPLNMTNCAFTFPNRGGNDATDSDVDPTGITPCIPLRWGQRDSTWDAGLVELASYGDFVWHDKDADGVQEAGEEGVAGVTVILYDAATNQPVKTTITNNVGYYLFDKLMPQQYYAKYIAPGGWNITTPNVGSDVKDSDVDGSNGPGTNATTYLSPGENDLTWDLGLWKCACISGDVWYDLNQDGIYQDVENGINGLSVFIYDAMTRQIVARTITGPKPGTASDDGYYPCQCLRPGMYYVEFARPGNLAAGPWYIGSNQYDSDITHENGINTTRKFTVLSGDHVPNIGAGFQNKATVGNFVWLDANANGVQDLGEKPMAGVTVAAYNPQGTMVSEATTNNSGVYMLDGIAKGDYFLKFTKASAQLSFTTPHVGLDEVDSDVDGTNGSGTTKLMRLNADDAVVNIDAGVLFAVLPLEWLSFDGKYNGSFTELNWATGVELNNSHFVIERRHESEKEFKEIGTEQASLEPQSARHEYAYDDYNVTESGVYYYRIKQVDQDGSFTYSNVISIRKNSKSEFTAYIYPNPVDNLLKVEIEMGEDGVLSVDVFDSNGKRVLSNPFGGQRKAGKYSEGLNVELLAAGNYVLRLQTRQGVINKKFTVAR